MKKSLEYFNNDSLADSVWLGKYAAEGEESPTEMHRRMSKEFYRVDTNYQKVESGVQKSMLSEYGKIRKDLTEKDIFEMFEGFKVLIPQGSVMATLGTNTYASLSNCVVIPSVIDSYGGITYTDSQLTSLFKRRCGVGFDISNLRPYNTPTKNSAKTSTGAVSFMERFSHSVRETSQCIEENQRVLTSNGLKPIRDVCIGDFVWTKKGFIKVIDVYSNGKKEIYKTTTKFGKSILTTEDHIFLSSNSKGTIEKKLKDLNIGDAVVLLNGVQIVKNLISLTHNFTKTIFDIKNQFGSYGKIECNNYTSVNIPKFLDTKLAYIVGYAHGDGYSDKNSLILAVNYTHNEILETIKKYNPFREPLVLKGDGCYKVVIANKEAMSFLNENGLHKPKTEFLRIPKLIWESSCEVQASYLSGLFDADGYASGSKGGYNFTTVNKEFADDIATLLLANGILSKIHIETERGENWQDLYKVTIVGEFNQRRFVNFLKESIKVRNKLWISKRDNYKSPYTACELGISYNNYDYIPSCDKKMSINCLDRCDEYTDEILTEDYILTKTKVESAITYDLALEEEYLFWCEGFYVHNSGRRGALMLTMDIRHPDILEFIKVKQDLTKVTGANISVRLNDEFMEAVEKDKDYILRFPCDVENPITTDWVVNGKTYKLTVPSNLEYNKLYDYESVEEGKVYIKKVRAKDIWNTLAESAHKTAEPGILFWDNMINYSPDGVYDKYRAISTNP